MTRQNLTCPQEKTEERWLQTVLQDRRQMLREVKPVNKSTPKVCSSAAAYTQTGERGKASVDGNV